MAFNVRLRLFSGQDADLDSPYAARQIDFWSDSDELNPWRSSAAVAEYELSGDSRLVSELELYGLKRAAAGSELPWRERKDLESALEGAIRPYVESNARTGQCGKALSGRYGYVFCEVSAVPAGDPVRCRTQAYFRRAQDGSVPAAGPFSFGVRAC